MLMPSSPALSTMTTETGLVSLLYIAALQAQKLRKNAQIVQEKSWFRNLAEVRSWLAANDMKL